MGIVDVNFRDIYRTCCEQHVSNYCENSTWIRSYDSLKERQCWHWVKQSELLTRHWACSSTKDRKSIYHIWLDLIWRAFLRHQWIALRFLCQNFCKKIQPRHPQDKTTQNLCFLSQNFTALMNLECYTSKVYVAQKILKTI